VTLRLLDQPKARWFAIMESVILPESAAGYGVTIRLWRPVDAEAMHEAIIASSDHLRKWMAWAADEPRTVWQRLELLVAWEQQWEEGGDAQFAIFGSSHELVGGCGLHHRSEPNVLEIGYWIHALQLRRGYATAAARLLTDIAFRQPGIEYVEIHHDKANEASRGVPLRLGYKFVGEKPDERGVPAEVGIDCGWRMTRSAWLEPI
jgi:ribosomal-protein-serine acetyltransferase